MHQERSPTRERSYFSPRLIKSPTAPHPSLESLKGSVAKRDGNPCEAWFLREEGALRPEVSG